MLKQLFVCCLWLFTASSLFAQGGKAEPNRVKFAEGKSSATLTGSLSNEQEMEYIFSARAGQKVTIKNTRTRLFDFRVFSKGEDFDTEFESSSTLTFAVPETGDYVLLVRKRSVRSPRYARFSLSLTIK